ncbi:50S ribosomal L9 C-terminal domain-containing protein, partial [Priestia megaterium]|uniref:50S ribosomal L9 C-terminal domain-containing protein n=1 Tax=Priestia megaterium TaxID=1404 RepID=UPI002E276723
ELTVELTAKSREHTPLFPSITTKQIPQQLNKKHKIKLHNPKIQLNHPIPPLPYTNLPLKLHPQLTPTLNVHLTEQK